jgi:hypothetical protein
MEGKVFDIESLPVPQASSRFTMIIGPPKRLRTPGTSAKIIDAA